MTRAKVLIVDDIPENLEVLYRTLKNDYEVYGAINGREALVTVREHRPDIILLDIMMPDMDGYAVCKALKADADLREIPVLFLTALTEYGNELAGFEAGAVDYILKPFKPAIVMLRIATHLQIQQQKNELRQKNRELSEALERIRVLSGLLPICMTCKKIRDDQGYWNQLESFISEHSDALFSHGYCPDCARKAMSELQNRQP